MSEDDDNSEQAFITTTNTNSNNNNTNNITINTKYIPELKNVRKQHNKIQKVVETFKNKVNIMIDKQRNDFVSSYENHVYDFHKEIFILRNRIVEIANDKAREEKIKDLDKQKNYYRLETMRLDNENNELTRKLKNLTSKIIKLETERDWLLKRLHYSKIKYSKLKKERNNIMLSLDNDNSLYSNSQDNTSLTLSLTSLKKKNLLKPLKENKINWKDKLFHDSIVSRTLPSISSSHDGFTNNAINNNNNNADVLNSLNENEDNILSQVITKRITKEEINQFIQYCYNNCNHSVWIRINKRPIDELIIKGEEIIDSLITDNNINHSELTNIATELAGYEETYDIILDILNEKQKMNNYMYLDSPKSSK